MRPSSARPTATATATATAAAATATAARASSRSFPSVATTIAASLVSLASLVGCAGPLADGEAQFTRGHYPEAKQTLAGLEGESRSWDRSTRAEYALYRGLTLAALGDRGRAAAWLREARALEDAYGGSLVESDARRLALAIDANEFPSEP